MEYKLPIRSNRRRNLIVAGVSILLIAAIAAGTFYALKYVGRADKSASVAETAPAEETSQQKADKLFVSGDLSAAKTAYEKALSEFQAANNESAAADVKMQLELIDNMTKTPEAPQNTDHGRVTVGAKQ